MADNFSLPKKRILSILKCSRKKIKACSQTFIKSISTEMHAIYTFSNINIGVSDDGERDLVKHVKTVKENAC
jgi:hypothetical protein